MRGVTSIRVGPFCVVTNSGDRQAYSDLSSDLRVWRRRGAHAPRRTAERGIPNTADLSIGCPIGPGWRMRLLVSAATSSASIHPYRTEPNRTAIGFEPTLTVDRSFLHARVRT